MIPCPGGEDLRRFLNGDQPEATEKAILAHLDDCADCLQTLEELTRIHTGSVPAGGQDAAVPASTDFWKRLADGWPGSRDQTPLMRRQPGGADPMPEAHRQALLEAGFEVTGVLGRGGMGVVYQARQIGLNRWVALKVISADAAADPQYRARFRTEAEVVARFAHPNIVRIYEVAQRGDLAYLVLEYVEGGTLAQHQAGKPQDPTAAAQLLETLARAMHYAHQRGIVHRDLKPANVLLTSPLAGSPLVSSPLAGSPLQSPEANPQAGMKPEANPQAGMKPEANPQAGKKPEANPQAGAVVKIADFGLAKRLDAHTHQTETGVLLGTPSYMAPEQATASHEQIGPTTDVYALGVVLYELLTGRPPFLGDTPLNTLHQVVSADPVPPARLQPRLPRDLETICLKCLQKSPNKRYHTADELADDLNRFLSGRPIKARRAGVIERTVKWARREPSQAALAGFGLFTLLALGVGWWLYNAQLTRTRNVARAEGLVASLATSDVAAVPRLVQDLEEVRPYALPLLLASLTESAPNSRQRLHTVLALLPTDSSLCEFLKDRLLSASPQEVLVIRDSLQSRAIDPAERFWPVATDPDADASRRLRAACALAVFAPNDTRWKDIATPVVRRLLDENPLLVVGWVEALRPVRTELLDPLTVAFADRQGGELQRRLATEILADYASDRPGVLANLLLAGDETQFAAIFARLSEHTESALPLLLEEIDKKPSADLPSSDGKREALAKRQANAAAALLRLNQPQRVWPLLRHGPDPRVRSYLLHRLSPLGIDPATLARRLEVEKDLSVRRALLLSLGEFDETTLPVKMREGLKPMLRHLYRTDPDPGLHSAAEWLLFTWKDEAWLKEANGDWAKDRAHREKASQAAPEGKAAPRWFVNGQGQTMVVVPGPVQFRMGSPTTESGRLGNETQHTRRIARTFAVASKAVTLEQFKVFQPNYELPPQFARMPTLPAAGVHWYSAVAYCNWLSEQEGIPVQQWCYEVKKGELYLKENCLSLTGYRLPTAAELEYATRAGSTTSRYFGETDELLGKYAWHQKNAQEQTWPVGQLKPNDLGLFDALGNVFCWCQDGHMDYPTQGVHEDTEGPLLVKRDEGRLSCGGGFNNPASQVRSAIRTGMVPVSRTTSLGFRVARTLR